MDVSSSTLSLSFGNFPVFVLMQQFAFSALKFVSAYTQTQTQTNTSEVRRGLSKIPKNRSRGPQKESLFPAMLGKWKIIIQFFLWSMIINHIVHGSRRISNFACDLLASSGDLFFSSVRSPLRSNGKIRGRRKSAIVVLYVLWAGGEPFCMCCVPSYLQKNKNLTGTRFFPRVVTHFFPTWKLVSVFGRTYGWPGGGCRVVSSAFDFSWPFPVVHFICGQRFSVAGGKVAFIGRRTHTKGSRANRGRRKRFSRLLVKWMKRNP